MKVAVTLLVLLIIPATISTAPALQYVKATDFSGVRHVRLSDFSPKPPPAPAVKPPVEWTYSEAVKRAKSVNARLVVWVGTEPDYTQAPDAIHVRVPSPWLNLQGDVVGPAMVIANCHGHEPMEWRETRELRSGRWVMTYPATSRYGQTTSTPATYQRSSGGSYRGSAPARRGGG